jgi:hypothetical protein
MMLSRAGTQSRPRVGNIRHACARGELAREWCRACFGGSAQRGRRQRGSDNSAYEARASYDFPAAAKAFLRAHRFARLLRLLDAYERIDDRVDVLGINRGFVGTEHLFNFGVPLIFLRAPAE